MPTYSTPAPIDLAINLKVGSIDVTASDRGDTVVTVSPTNPTKSIDRRGADETTVDFDGTRLTITGPKPRFSIIGPSESVDLMIELPEGSRLTTELGMGALHTAGRLGATRIKSSMGAVDVGATADLWLRAGHGNATVGTVDGTAEITADHGRVRIASVSGDATVKASHGSILVGQSGSDLEARLSYGDLEITRALGSVTAKTAYGSIDLLEVSSGSVEVESAMGQISVGVRVGVPAWLDLSTKQGRVRNQLDGDRAPEASEASVAVHARTQAGNIDVHRAHS